MRAEKRVFDIDVCPNYGDRVRIIAAIVEPR